jgi:TonB family protein
MKKYFYILILVGFSCFGQVGSNNSDANKIDEVISFNKVDIIPIFVNCKNEKRDLQRDCVVNFINTHIEKNLKYPEEAKRVNLESKVFCTFIIDERGKVTVTEAKGKPTSFKKAFENEAIRVLNLLPKFIPAKHNNQVVKVQAQCEVAFKLENTGIIRVNETIESYPVVSNTVAEERAEENSDVVIPIVVIEQVPLFEECKTIPKEKQRDCFQEMMMSHIKKHFYYPEEAQENKIQGRVVILFIIEKDGSINEITSRGPNILLEDAATNVIKKMPKLIPGKQRGKTVRASYSVPIIFKL